MAEIRCPMCGKPNPEEAQRCVFCRAQLRPLMADGQTQQPTSSSSGESDWLKGLRHATGEEPLPSGEEDRGEEPDWLARIRQRAEAERQSSEGGEGSIPFWQGDVSEDASGVTGGDWLSQLRSVTSASQEPGGEPSSLQEERRMTTGELRDVNDRLRRIAGEPANFSTGTPSEPQPPEMASPPSEAEQPVQRSDEETTDLTEWLRSLEEASVEHPPTETGRFAIPLEGVGAEPAYGDLEEFPGESELGGPPEGEQPDWLRTFAEMPAPESGETPQPQIEGQVEVPDWLQGLAKEPVAEPPSFAPTETPDWLKSFEEMPPMEAGAAASAGTVEARGGEETPDWLKAFEEEIPPEEGTPAVSEPVGEPVVEEETPDWLLELASSFASEAAPGQPSSVEPPTPPFAEEPSSQIEHPPETKEFAAKDLEGVFQTKPIPAETAPAETEDLVAWLSELGEEEAIDKKVISKAFILEEQQPPSEELPPASYPFAGIDTELLGPEESETPGGEAVEGLGELAPALLPPWLQALRPVEAVIEQTELPEEEVQAERAGPLAGLRGVLPADRLVIQYRKPPIYSIKLRLTEKQRQQVDVLDNLIKAEGKPAEVKRENLQVPRQMLRLMLAVTLIIVLLIPLLISSPSIVPTGLIPGEDVQGFYSQINLLVPDRPVLLAVDYEAGYQGEMRFAATGVLETLMRKRQRLAIVSTVPAGPLLASDLLERAQLKLAQVEPTIRQGYALPDRTVNLGYLPGGLTSLQEFATFPRKAVFAGLGMDLNTQQNVWSHSVVQNVYRLSDFAGLILVTDRVDTARAWIEQVEPALEGRPLLIITSAQVAPMLAPYVNSGQVEAMIWGIAGGMAYEQLAGVPAHAAAYWDAYRYGMYVGFAFILSGVLLRSITVFFSRRRTQNEA